MRLPSPKKVAVAAAKGLAASGYVLAGTVLCASCAGLPLLSGVFGGLAVGARFGLSAGVVSGVMLLFVLVRRRRGGDQLCPIPSAGGEVQASVEGRPR
jgi:hypothetical protein